MARNDWLLFAAVGAALLAFRRRPESTGADAVRPLTPFGPAEGPLLPSGACFADVGPTQPEVAEDEQTQPFGAIAGSVSEPAPVFHTAPPVVFPTVNPIPVTQPTILHPSDPDPLDIPVLVTPVPEPTPVLVPTATPQPLDGVIILPIEPVFDIEDPDEPIEIGEDGVFIMLAPGQPDVFLEGDIFDNEMYF